MKKIMFSDKFGLTEAVLSGRKTQTRRIVPQKELDKACEFAIAYFNETFDVFTDDKEVLQHYFFVEEIGKLPYKVGEVVAVAMSYKTVVEHLAKKSYDVAKWLDDHNITSNLAGWLNKMFVTAGLMPYRIRITKVRVERLQDISDEDCLAEGVVKEVKRIPTETEQYVTQYYPSQVLKEAAERVGWGRVYDSPKLAYEVLIGYISGKSVWEENPYVFVYDFEIVD